MVNAWSLAGSIMNGTFEEDYPLMDKKKYIYESPDGGKTVYGRRAGDYNNREKLDLMG